MKFNTIELTNFKQYKNSVINFDEGVNLIEGENGFGKSTLMGALHFALYGLEAMYNSKLVPRNKELVNQENIVKNDFGEILAFKDEWAKVELSFDVDDGTTYKIIREVKLDVKNDEPEEKLKVLKMRRDEGGEARILDHKEEGEYFKYIPEKIAPLLFFDGERIKSIEEVLNTSTKSTKFAEEIENILQIKEAEEIKRFINLTAKKIIDGYTDVDVTKKQEEVSLLEQKIEINKAKIQENKQELEEISKNLELWELKEQENKRNLEFNQKIKNIDIETKTKEEIIEGKRVALKKNLVMKKGEKIKYELFNEIFEKITNSEEIYEITGIEQKAVDDILKNNKCICGTCLDEKLKYNLLNVRNTLPPESFQSILVSQKGNGNRVLSDEEELENFVISIENIRDSLEELKDKRRSYASQVSDSGNTEFNYEETISRKALRTSELNQLAIENSRYDRERKEKESILNKALKDNQKQKLDYKVHCLLKETVDYMEADIEDVKLNIKNRVEERLNIHANVLIKDTVSIKLDKNLYPYKVDFANKSVSTSTGQGVLVSISYLFALIDVATTRFCDSIETNEKFPLVFDNVTATLDENHTNNLMTNLKEYDGQVIMLANSKDIKPIASNFETDKKISTLDKEKDSKVTTIGVKYGI